MGCYGAGIAGGFVCLQVNRPGPQNPAVPRQHIAAIKGCPIQAVDCPTPASAQVIGALLPCCNE
ncbi:hypothetical protein Poly51_62180 [Rubripirellula tenax]|uniref:Uncharacterized protein n=1 Tax=Rubripirellula tenax TaxID=2528015 RepID=A0A5C6E8A1_9BACT|nr:hypothetical protein Poly51_62180 [Rubripirellula tenax]